MGHSIMTQGTTASRDFRESAPALAQVSRMLKSYLHTGKHSRRPEGVNFPNTPVWVSTDPAAAPLRVRLSFTLCWMNHQWFLSQDCQKQTGANECRCWHSGSWTGSTVSFCTVTAQLSNRTVTAITEPGEEWSQITTQKCLHFIINFEPYVGISSTKAFRDTVVWKYKLANLRCFFVRLIFHWSYLPTQVHIQQNDAETSHNSILSREVNNLKYDELMPSWFRKLLIYWSLVQPLQS